MIMNESGFFWLSNLSEGELAVPGQLTIDDKGIVELELHQSLAGRIGAEEIFGTVEIDKEIYILGILKKSGKHITLKNIRTNGAQIGHISYEKFVADICLVSNVEIKTEKFKAIRIPLNNLNDWSHPGTFDYLKNSELTSAINITLNENNSWSLDDGTLKLVNHLEGKTPNLQTVKLDVSITSHFYFELTQSTEIDDLLDKYHGLQDLLMILINDKASVGWPLLYWEDNEVLHTVECYFRRHHLTENAFKWLDVTVPFPRIRDKFGAMVTTWYEKRKTLGPGINLYLSILKNKSTYAENIFVNMVWGLEALDRRNDLNSDVMVKSKLEEKIKRISDIIKENKILTSDDRRWLMKALSRDNERSLAERLYDTFLHLNLDIEPPLLRTFCDSCAHLRNDLSHHGGERTPGEYDKFIKKLIPHLHALSTLYLLVMLDILQIENEELKRIIYYYPGYHKHRNALMSVGLIPDTSPFPTCDM
ncbi:HEPN domain-containing protein [Edwardsiella piscicida]